MWGQRRENSDTDEWRAWWGERGERELRCILMTAWDPIGVGDAPEAWSEYDEYASQVARVLHETTDPHESASRVAQHLNEAECKMEMHTDQSRMATPGSQIPLSPGTSGPTRETARRRPRALAELQREG